MESGNNYQQSRLNPTTISLGARFVEKQLSRKSPESPDRHRYLFNSNNKATKKHSSGEGTLNKEEASASDSTGTGQPEAFRGPAWPDRPVHQVDEGPQRGSTSQRRNVRISAADNLSAGQPEAVWGPARPGRLRCRTDEAIKGKPSAPDSSDAREPEWQSRFGNQADESKQREHARNTGETSDNMEASQPETVWDLPWLGQPGLQTNEDLHKPVIILGTSIPGTWYLREQYVGPSPISNGNQPSNKTLVNLVLNTTYNKGSGACIFLQANQNHKLEAGIMLPPVSWSHRNGAGDWHTPFPK